MSNSKEMPKYKCHKEVCALKIKSIDRNAVGLFDGSAVITPEEVGYEPFKVDREYLNKHKPYVGGYFVMYEGGYESFSPAEAFESGYEEIESPQKIKEPTLDTPLKKPPIGLIPKKIYEEQIKMSRFDEVSKAIFRYHSARLKIDISWIEEYNELVEELKGLH